MQRLLQIGVPVFLIVAAQKYGNSFRKRKITAAIFRDSKAPSDQEEWLRQAKRRAILSRKAGI